MKVNLWWYNCVLWERTTKQLNNSKWRSYGFTLTFSKHRIRISFGMYAFYVQWAEWRTRFLAIWLKFYNKIKMACLISTLLLFCSTTIDHKKRKLKFQIISFPKMQWQKHVNGVKKEINLSLLPNSSYHVRTFNHTTVL